MSKATLGLVHPALLPFLPRRLLLATHLTVCNLRGPCWGSQAPLLRFVSLHSWELLFQYHLAVLSEMRARAYKPMAKWSFLGYRGEDLAPWPIEDCGDVGAYAGYPEHTPKSYKVSWRSLRARMVGPSCKEESIEDLYRMHEAPESV